MNNHPVVNQIVESIKASNGWYEFFEHEEVITSEQAEAVRPEYSLKQGTKALIVKLELCSGEKEFAMIVVPGDKKFNTKKVRKSLNVRDVRFASPEDVAELTGGVKVGGVPPFGNLFGMPVYAEETIFENETIIFSAGDRSVSVAMKSEDYRQLVDPTVLSLV